MSAGETVPGAVRLVSGDPVAQEIEALADRLDPGVNRDLANRQFDQLFRSGSVPDPAPGGFLPGRLLATTVFPPFDRFTRWLSGLWMPWQGKDCGRWRAPGSNDGSSPPTNAATRPRRSTAGIATGGRGPR